MSRNWYASIWNKSSRRMLQQLSIIKVDLVGTLSVHPRVPISFFSIDQARLWKYHVVGEDHQSSALLACYLTNLSRYSFTHLTPEKQVRVKCLAVRHHPQVLPVHSECIGPFYLGDLKFCLKYQYSCTLFACIKVAHWCVSVSICCQGNQNHQYAQHAGGHLYFGLDIILEKGLWKYTLSMYCPGLSQTLNM